MLAYCPVALTPEITKCFERLVQHHIKACLPPSLDPHQYANQANRSTEEAIATAVHTALCHLEQKGSHVRMLFVDYSLAFNTNHSRHPGHQASPHSPVPG